MAEKRLKEEKIITKNESGVTSEKVISKKLSVL